MREGIKFHNENLDAFIKALGTVPKARVGILGAKNQREEAGKTNAEIGKKHEFGEDGMPKRSFLRMPISTKLRKEIEDSGGFKPEVFQKIIDERSLREWVKKVAICAEACVAKAFDTGGFGQWKPSNMDNKKVHQTLVETQQLRNSIISEVK